MLLPYAKYQTVLGAIFPFSVTGTDGVRCRGSLYRGYSERANSSGAKLYPFEHHKSGEGAKLSHPAAWPFPSPKTFERFSIADPFFDRTHQVTCAIPSLTIFVYSWTVSFDD